MKNKYQNGFFILGIVILVIMVIQLNFTDVWNGLTHAGYWSLAIVALWTVLHVFNTAARYLIIWSSESVHPPQESMSGDSNAVGGPEGKMGFRWLYKTTVSGFAFDYAILDELMGSEPCRIMKPSLRTGAKRMSLSVILYVMIYIFTHFCLWVVCIMLHLLTQSMSVKMGLLLTVTTASCRLGIRFLLVGYQKGLVMCVTNVLRHVPLAKKWAQPFMKEHRRQLDTVDGQIAALRQQNPRIFLSAVALEIACRFLSALKMMLILTALMPHVDYLHCVLVLAFTSLFANLLSFTLPQLGGHEGGFLMSISALGMMASTGTFVALLIRLRELVWTGIGLLSIKINERRGQDQTKAVP